MLSVPARGARCVLSHILDWASNFVLKTGGIRSGGEHLLLVNYAYNVHTQNEVLRFWKDTGIVVIGLPAYTSHVLQLLDVSVYAGFKSILQQELDKDGRLRRKLGCFDVGTFIQVSYYKSFTVRNIRSSFEKAVLWNPITRSTSVEAFKDLSFLIHCLLYKLTKY